MSRVPQACSGCRLTGRSWCTAGTCSTATARASSTAQKPTWWVHQQCRRQRGAPHSPLTHTLFIAHTQDVQYLTATGTGIPTTYWYSTLSSTQRRPRSRPHPPRPLARRYYEDDDDAGTFASWIAEVADDPSPPKVWPPSLCPYHGPYTAPPPRPPWCLRKPLQSRRADLTNNLMPASLPCPPGHQYQLRHARALPVAGAGAHCSFASPRSALPRPPHDNPRA